MIWRERIEGVREGGGEGTKVKRGRRVEEKKGGREMRKGDEEGR